MELKNFMWILVLFCFVAFIGCNKLFGGDVDLVKKGYLDINSSITVGQALDGYTYFTTKDWKAYKNEQGKRLVLFTGVYNGEYLNKINQSGTKIDSITAVIIFKINNDDTFEIVSKIRKNKQSDTENFIELNDNMLKTIYRNESDIN